MKNSLQLKIGLALALACRVTHGQPETSVSETDPASAVPLCVMTFNLRYASADPPNAWPQRRPLMRECIRGVAPDLIGTQEGLYEQLKEIAADLPDYTWVGQGRDGGSHGEFMAVFFRSDRFEPLEYDHFWLSDTPNVVASSTWGNVNRRMVTWVRFRDKQTSQEFHFWNTHLDHAVERARSKGAELIRDRILALQSSLPLILTGDFNCRGGSSAPWSILMEDGGLVDTWSVAREHDNERLNTFNGFTQPKQEGNRIDWILVRGDVQVDKAAIIDCSAGDRFPSDHFPVVAWLRLDTEQPSGE